MLNAIIHGKAGRIHIEKDTDSFSWRQLYQQREDLLTAAFFSHFTYLSCLLQHHLLKSWLVGSGDATEFTGDFTAFKRVEFWPRYDLPDDDTREFVEPDLLLRFEHCDVLIEVKPPQGGMQHHQQWENEIAGYFSQDSEQHPLYFLAIGRVGNALTSFTWKPDFDGKLKAIQTIEWTPIAHELYQLKQSQKLDAQDHRIVGDMLQALELYGIRTYELKWSDLKTFYKKQSLDLNVLNTWER